MKAKYGVKYSVKYSVAIVAFLALGSATQVSAQQPGATASGTTAPRAATPKQSPPALQPQPLPAQTGTARMSPALTMLMQGITLTDSQKVKLESVVQTSRAEIAKTRDSILAAATPPDSAGRARMLDLVNREYIGIRAVLTTEQQAAFDSRLAELQAAIRARMASQR